MTINGYDPQAFVALVLLQGLESAIREHRHRLIAFSGGGAYWKRFGGYSSRARAVLHITLPLPAGYAWTLSERALWLCKRPDFCISSDFKYLDSVRREVLYTL